MRTLPFVLALLLASTLAAVEPPVITSVSPSAGPPLGGTAVVITGRNFALPPDFACILPCPATVRFGDTTVVPSAATDTRLDVIAPPHAPDSTVDVTVTTGDGRTATAPGAFRYLESIGDFERILLPVYAETPVAGAHGSSWQTDFWLRNNGTTDAIVLPWSCPPGVVCPAIYPLNFRLKAGSSVHNGVETPRGGPGRLLYVSSPEAADVSGGLRIADRSRSTTGAGTEIPLVRERDFRSAPVQLHNVPLNSGFRVMVRIYELALPAADFRVTAYNENEGDFPPTPGLSTKLTARSPGQGSLEPAYAQYGSLTDLLMMPVIWPPIVRLEVEPLTPGSRFWAFASITNDETQHVTLVTPQ